VRVRPTQCLLIIAILVSSTSALYAQAPVRVGAEFRVNTYTIGIQANPDVGVRPNGDFVAVWRSDAQDGSSTGVFGQRFTSSGSRVGGEFLVNTRTLDGQGGPAIAVDADGDFIVVWTSVEQDGSGGGVFGQRFDSSGGRVAAEFAVSQYTVGNQTAQAIASTPSGGFVVAWLGPGGPGGEVLVRRFDMPGSVNETSADVTASVFTSDVALDSDDAGNFVVVWDALDGDDRGIFGRRFDSIGSALGGEFRANHVVTGRQYRPSVGLDADGDFVVVWQSQGQYGSGYDIFARPFDKNGAISTLDVLVNAQWQGDATAPDVRLDADGDYVVAWHNANGNQDIIFSRRFKAGALPTSGDLLTNSHTQLFDDRAAIDSTADGDFVVLWHGEGDGAGNFGVSGQRFRIPNPLDVDGNGQLDPLTDGLLKLRFEFGFTGNALIAGAVGAGCTRCDSASILAYLQQL